MSQSSSRSETECEEIRIGNIGIIREIYDGSDSKHSPFSLRLEKYLEKGCDSIVIEPHDLGDETARWIRVGNFVHKTAVLTGVGCIVTGPMFPSHPMSWATLGLVSVAFTTLYTACWGSDPCCKYQVEMDTGKLAGLFILLDASNSTTSTPLVLSRRDDSKRKILHCTISLLAGAYCLHKYLKHSY